MEFLLATELRDAGYKQPKVPEDYNGVYIDKDGNWTGEQNDGAVYAPTLEELIEACGKPFALDCTSQNVSGAFTWFAWHPDKKQNASGSTPTEAVARLWLALNKKV